MTKPVLSWQSEDGKLHPDQITSTKHEIMADLRKSFPDLKSSLQLIEARLPDLCAIFSPMVHLLEENHPEAGKTTREPPVAECRPMVREDIMPPVTPHLVEADREAA